MAKIANSCTIAHHKTYSFKYSARFHPGVSRFILKGDKKSILKIQCMWRLEQINEPDYSIPAENKFDDSKSILNSCQLD